MEQEQLNRFVHADSLNREIKSALMLFSPAMIDSIKANLISTSDMFSKTEIQKAEIQHFAILQNKSYFHTFELLRNLLSPYGKPYFICHTILNNNMRDQFMYSFNSYLQEEVQFWKYYLQTVDGYMKNINSYSQYNSDESYININGRIKNQLNVLHYDIDASINEIGDVSCESTLKINVLNSPTQFVQFDLLPTLQVDSIVDEKNKQIMFFRNTSEVISNNKTSSQIGLIFQEPYIYNDTIDLKFYYHGTVGEMIGGVSLFAETNWYPSYCFNDRATFDMFFKSDVNFLFASCGYLDSSEVKEDTLFTFWKVRTQVPYVTFKMAKVKKYLFTPDDVVPVDVYYSKELHAEYANFLSKKLSIGIDEQMEAKISNDVMNALRVFAYYFGPYTLPKISVAEVTKRPSESFPGFVALGFNSFINTDIWNNDRLQRAQEVAQQWWGVDVSYATYHDQWLSEGFAEYASLMYLQGVTDNYTFLNKLKEYRNDIFTHKDMTFSSDAESGPIALGKRTSSSNIDRDDDLVIYKKGAFVLHMLRNMMIDLKTMNEDNFLNMLKEFYGSNRGKNVTTQDFKRIAEKYTGENLDWFFKQWVYQSSLPEYEFSFEMVHNDSTKLLDAHCTIVTSNVPDDFKMYVPLEIQFNDNTKAYIRLQVDSPNYSFVIPSLSQRPKGLVLNPFESVLAKIKQ